eukprot:g6402.t1
MRRSGRPPRTSTKKRVVGRRVKKSGERLIKKSHKPRNKVEISPRTDAMEDLKRELKDAGIGLNIASGLENYSTENLSGVGIDVNLKKVDGVDGSGTITSNGNDVGGSSSPNAMAYNLRQQIYLLEMECAVLRQQQGGGTMSGGLGFTPTSIISDALDEDDKSESDVARTKKRLVAPKRLSSSPSSSKEEEKFKGSSSLTPSATVTAGGIGMSSSEYKTPSIVMRNASRSDTFENTPGASVSLGNQLAHVQAAYDRSRLQQRDDRLKWEKKVRDQVILVEAQNEQLSQWEQRLKSEQEAMERREQSLEKRLREKTHANIATRKRAHALEAQLTAVKEELSSTVSKLQAKTEEADASIRALEAKMKQQVLDLSIAEKQIAHLSGHSGSMKTKFTISEEKLMQAEAERQTLKEKVASLNSALDNAEVARRMAEKRAEQTQALAAKAQEECAKLVQQAVGIERKTRELEMTLQLTQQTVDEREKDLERWRQDHSDVKQQDTLNKVALEEMTAALRIARDGHQNAETQLASSQDEIATLRRRCEEAEQKSRDLEARVSALDQENTELHTKHRAAQTNAERFEAAEKQRREQLSLTEKKVLILEADARLLRQEVEKVRKLRALPLDRFKHLQQSNMANAEMLKQLMEAIAMPPQPIDSSPTAVAE